MPKITEMYAFVAADKGPEDEGVMAMQTVTGWMPLVGADMVRVNDLKPIAEMIAKNTGKPYRILRFKLEGEIPK